MILIAIKDRLEKNIPTISLIDLLLSKNNKITIFCYSCSPTLYNYYINKGVSFKFTYISFPKGFLNKILNIINFRLQFSKIVSNPLSGINNIIFGSLDTAYYLYHRIGKKRVIIHVRELYEKERRFINFIKRISQIDCQFIFTDYLRLSVYKTKTQFKVLPILFPNKLYSHPRKLLQSDYYNDQLLDIYQTLNNKEVYLYQGFIGPGRNLNNFANALSIINNPKKILVLMGAFAEGGYEYLNKLKNIYHNTIHISHINYPDYLKITSLAHVGLVSYNTSNLNNIFCAPNKIYEYSGFGIPVIGNDIPCLKLTIDKFNFGKIYNEDNINSIINIINEIDINYDFYSKNSDIFFESFNFDEFYSQLKTFFYDLQN